MSAMELMAVNVLSKMLGMSAEEMQSKVGDFGATLNEFVTRLENIETNTTAILAKMEAMENDGDSGKPNARSGRRGKPALIDASAVAG